MSQPGDGPLVVGIGGSTSAHSVTSLLLRTALDLLADQGARTEAYLGAQLLRLPMYAASDGDGAGDVASAAAAVELVESVRRADALVIATPGYHGGMSGVVKNAIDHLEALREDARPYLDGRAVGLIVAASGWQACGTTLAAARSVVHALRGWPTPLGVMVNSAEQAPGPDGQLDERTSNGLQILASQLTEFTSRRADLRHD